MNNGNFVAAIRQKTEQTLHCKLCGRIVGNKGGNWWCPYHKAVHSNLTFWKKHELSESDR